MDLPSTKTEKFIEQPKKELFIIPSDNPTFITPSPSKEETISVISESTSSIKTAETSSEEETKDKTFKDILTILCKSDAKIATDLYDKFNGNLSKFKNSGIPQIEEICSDKTMYKTGHKVMLSALYYYLHIK